ncbi:F0F1 ATP synthase subunit B [Helicobacter acinonychis]|uniref:ATP synthase subunit b n=1 Tax=Helicobacter acinonychis (strain Sheeba) TaxID=382638 RepID=ATPF_HELAH|nr:F0F1 ATP synthase subunit B [Helicobacter acinonychis]Q17Y82.1 RecName: Full=ATP synthase subunit b; AltName: Full=ATP synthase F(0) sector subunit b; AltName: Full=ATPase subunit I; AltName: Full=F-type ATPase subunit b; Short=F-ATPase subunit b [Helicobacter acinonychis str. Sheeba]CAJ99394.1 ATP synthase F0, subunit b [Helicobacter acinonychis str. Sheeba]STP03973.1 F0F1 ATP synthase subunit B [Helicobacter acinonychis]
MVLVKMALGFLILLSPLCAMELDISQTDIIERSLNFLLFVGILWYFLAKKLRSFLHAKSLEISKHLDEIQAQLKASKENKKKLLKELEQAKEKAELIVSDANKEAYTITQKYELQTKIDVENLIKNSKALMDLEVKKIKRELVESVFKDLRESKKVSFSTQDCVNILKQRL